MVTVLHSMIIGDRNSGFAGLADRPVREARRQHRWRILYFRATARDSAEKKRTESLAFFIARNLKRHPPKQAP